MVEFLSGKRRQILRAIWAILCKNTIIDQRSNNISLIEVIDEISLPAPAPESVTETSGQPAVGFDASLVILWARSDPDMPEKAQVRNSVVTPKGFQTQSTENEIDLTDALRVRSIGQIARFPLLSQDGEHTLKIEMKAADTDWQEAFELPLWVNIQTDSPLEQPSAN